MRTLYPSDFWFVLYMVNNRIYGEAVMPHAMPNVSLESIPVVVKIAGYKYHLIDRDGNLEKEQMEWFASQYHNGRTKVIQVTVN